MWCAGVLRAGGGCFINARQPTSGHACWLYAFKYRLIVRFVSRLGAQSANQGTLYGSRLPAVLVFRRAAAMVLLQFCWALMELFTDYHSSCVSLACRLLVLRAGRIGPISRAVLLLLTTRARQYRSVPGNSRLLFKNMMLVPNREPSTV